MEGAAGDVKAKVVEEDGAGTLRRLLHVCLPLLSPDPHVTEERILRV